MNSLRLSLLCVLAVLAMGADDKGKKVDLVDGNKWKVSIGTESPVEVNALIDLFSEFSYVFGDNCKNEGSCSKGKHAGYDPLKQKDTDRKANQLQTDHANYQFKADQWTSKVKVGDEVIDLGIGVVTEGNAEAKKLDFPDAVIGLGFQNEKESLVQKLLAKSGDNNIFFIQDTGSESPKGVTHFGTKEVDKKVCKSFDFQKTDNKKWVIPAKVVFDGKDMPAGVAVLPNADLRVSKNFYAGNKLNEEQYKKYKDLVIILEKKNYTIPKDKMYKKKDKEYEFRGTLDETGHFDIGLGSLFLKDYCVQYKKDGNDYKIGLAERSAANSLVSFSVFMLTSLFALLKLF